MSHILSKFAGITLIATLVSGFAVMGWTQGTNRYNTGGSYSIGFMRLECVAHLPRQHIPCQITPSAVRPPSHPGQAHPPSRCDPEEWLKWQAAGCLTV